ncbi:hypothetical protein [Paenibacillus senegalensis]|uniref:hypothetical protein n=1 Tax=Paenibacillus senegalensis TaxID=1465766 RepID=UPI0004753DC8|nr:hypothetical protein [Paenibacillus senegalensis]
MLLHMRSGETYPVTFLALHPYDIKNQMRDWVFNWSVYFNHPEVEVYKMVINGNNVIQGAIALEGRKDHVYIHLIESLPNNRKELDLIGEHLIAFACKRSIELGHEGFVMLQSKTKEGLISFYVNHIGAQHIGRGHMIISDAVANRLIMLYL